MATLDTIPSAVDKNEASESPSAKSVSADNFLKVYLNQIGRHAQPSPEEQQEIALDLERLRGEFRRSLLREPLAFDLAMDLLEAVTKGERAASRVFSVVGAQPDEATGLLEGLPETLAELRNLLFEARKDGAHRRGEKAFEEIRSRLEPGVEKLEEMTVQFRFLMDIFRSLRSAVAEMLWLDRPARRFPTEGERRKTRSRLRQLEVQALSRAPELRERLAKIETQLEQYELCKRNMAAKNLRLVVNIVGKTRQPANGVPYLDLIQEGNRGLLKALDKFEASRGFRFSTYATWWIRQAVHRASAEQGSLIRLPVNRLEMLQKFRAEVERMWGEEGRAPTLHEAARLLGRSPEEGARMVCSSQRPVSLEHQPIVAKLQDEDDLPEIDRALLRSRLNQVLEGLSPREQGILRLRYGLEDGLPRTLEEVGSLYNVTRERVRQIEKRAVVKLRKPRVLSRLATFLDVSEN